MLKIQKAATIAAVILAAASVTIHADPSFAIGNIAADTSVKAGDIIIDPAVLSADSASAASDISPSDPEFTKPDVGVTILGNGDVIFAPGTGDAQPMTMPGDITNADGGSSSENAEKQPVAQSLAALVQQQNTNAALSGEEYCLAGAVYFESKSESLAGQLAVAKVILARSKSGRFPATICGVVYQKSQFSFVQAGRMPGIDTASRNWKNAVAIAKIALDDSWQSPVEGALFFHARYVNPGWRLQRIGSVDNHVFYR